MSETNTEKTESSKDVKMCEAKTLKGEPCKKKAVNGDFCSYHKPKDEKEKEDKKPKKEKSEVKEKSKPTLKTVSYDEMLDKNFDPPKIIYVKTIKEIVKGELVISISFSEKKS